MVFTCTVAGINSTTRKLNWQRETNAHMLLSIHFILGREFRRF